jgi:hypothetical protein
MIARTLGPFDNVIRPFTVNESNTLVFVNINGLLGFEVGDLFTGKKLFPVEFQWTARLIQSGSASRDSFA